MPGGEQIVKAGNTGFVEYEYRSNMPDCYHTIGNTDGSLAQDVPASSQSTVVDCYSMRYTAREPKLCRGFALIQNGGIGITTVLGGVLSVRVKIYNLKIDGSGDPSTQVDTQDLTITLSASTNVWFPAYFAYPIALPVGRYAWCMKINPSINAGQIARGNFVYYQDTHSTPKKIASQGAFNAAWPADLSAATWVDWNSGGAGTSQVAAFADFIQINQRAA